MIWRMSESQWMDVVAHVSLGRYGELLLAEAGRAREAELTLTQRVAVLTTALREVDAAIAAGTLDLEGAAEVIRRAITPAPKVVP